MKCFPCAEVGHYARSCPKKVCSLCGSVGHVAKACPEASPTSALADVTTSDEVGECGGYAASNFVDVRFTDSARAATGSTGGADEARSVVCFSTRCLFDSEVIDAGMLAVLPTGIRERSRISVCDSGSSVHCLSSCLGMTNYCKLTGRRLMLASPG